MRALHDAGYEVVIFTNESSIGNTRNMDPCRRAIAKKTTRLDEWCEVVNALGVPVDVYISGAERGGASRKPRAGMWDVMKAVRRERGMSPVDAGNSFFVGDAAGRRGREGRRDDHSDADIGFARNAGVAFYTESSFFKTWHREEDYTTSSEYRSTAMLASAGGGGGGGEGEATDYTATTASGATASH
jgi:bifunctional polynucleotide phosphatase/kinase